MLNSKNVMKSKLRLTNRKTGEQRTVSASTWDYMQSDGRSRFWTPEIVNEVKATPKPPKPAKKEKEEIKIEPIKFNNKTENEDGETN